MRGIIWKVAFSLISNLIFVAAAGDFGPDTCLEGYVWREAFPNDHVCVAPATRSQAAADNTQAAARANPNGTCKQGYVWREARPSDHVCVTPAVRSQTASDNSQAANRKASLKVWLTHWFPPPVCHGNICSSTSIDGYPRFKVNGDHFNLASVTVYIYRTSNNKVLFSKTVTAKVHAGYVGGSFGVQANIIDCAGFPKADDGYVRVYDSNSKRWSASINVKLGCAVL